MNAADDEAEALLIVRDVLEWSLTPGRWAAVDRSVAALTAALAADDAAALQEAMTTLELSGPVRSSAGLGGDVRVRAPDHVLARLQAAIGILEELPGPAAAEPREFPVTVYLSDDAIHEQVERAVEALADLAGLLIVSRLPPVTGSWFRRLRAMLRSPAEEVLLSAAHAADARYARRPDAEVTAMLLQNLGPVITALQPTKDAAVRVGAVLIVKVDWTVVVHQLTPRQQLVLDHSPGLEAEPHQILPALGLPPAGPGPDLS